MKTVRVALLVSSFVVCISSLPSISQAQFGGFIGEQFNRVVPPEVQRIIPPAVILGPQAVIPSIIAPHINPGVAGRAAGDALSLGQTGRERDEERARQERDRAAQAAQAASAARQTEKTNLDAQIASRDSQLVRYGQLLDQTSMIEETGLAVLRAVNDESARRAQGSSSLDLGGEQAAQLQIDLEIVMAALRPGEGGDTNARVNASHPAARRLLAAAQQRGVSVQGFVANALRSVNEGNVSFAGLFQNASALSAHFRVMREIIVQERTSLAAERASLAAQRAALN